MKLGDVMTFRAFHADGMCYREYEGVVVSITETCSVLASAIGDTVRQPNGDWQTKFNALYYVMPNVWYLPEELYLADGTYAELYVNINSPVVIDGNTISYIDYELDVSATQGKPIEILDEDEFAEAIKLYGYSESHQQACWQAVREATALAEHRQPRGWGV